MIKKLSKEVPAWNVRMLDLMKDAIRKGTIKDDKEWCAKIGVLQTNIKGYQQGTRSFTIDQLIRAAKLHETTLDYLCGLTDKKAIPGEDLSPISMIEQGLEMLKIQGFQP